MIRPPSSLSPHETVSGEADQWYSPPTDPRSQQTVWGNVAQLQQLKAKHPHLRVTIAVGGWTLSDHFSTVCATAAGRERFAESLVRFLDTYRMFDGIDFDWKYPGGGGESGNSAGPDDGRNDALRSTLTCRRACPHARSSAARPSTRGPRGAWTTAVTVATRPRRPAWCRARSRPATMTTRIC
ncbi:MAG: hypothetical protein FJ284_07095 [Planctomycetes bacterium]|nr:hypothetical protein [Planctomycetota bacterium]